MPVSASLIANEPPDLEIAGGWTCEAIALNQQETKPIDLLNLWLPADADAVLDEQLRNDNEDDPFWCYLWPTARTLAQQVWSATVTDRKAQNTGTAPNSVESLKVLETGCGIGLVGLAALAGGADVTFQDVRSRSVDLALHNAAVNGFGDRAQGQAVDWRSPPVQTFDWIIASDVLYHDALHQPLLEFLCRTLDSTSDCIVSDGSRLQDVGIRNSIWIGDPGRRQAQSFIDLAERIFNIFLFDHNLTFPAIFSELKANHQLSPAI